MASKRKQPLEPLPCPFCGEPPKVQPWHGGGSRKTMVSCESPVCLASPQVTGSTRRTAVEGWNWRRGAEAARES